MRVLAISGSLRKASSNSAILRIAARVAPEGISVDVHDELDALPFFNPDLDQAFDDPALPAAVRSLRSRISASDAILISSPEYAHGVSGMLKNALDWLVGGPEMVDKPVALINTSPHATHAIAALSETLRTMSVHLVPDACLTLAVPRNCSDDDLVANALVLQPVQLCLERLSLAARSDRRSPKLGPDSIHRA